MTAYLGSFALWFAVWTLLSWPVDLREIVTGVLAATFVTLMTADMFVRPVSPKRSRGILAVPVKIWWFAVYVAVFLWECFKANLDVAFRVLHPAVPIRPGTIRVKTELTSDAGLTFLANSMTLTPGTTAVDIDTENGFLYVHWLSVRGDAAGGYRLPVVSRYERILKRIFE